MIDLQEVLKIHRIIIDRFGGTHEVRDLALLESALNRPFATFDAKDLYPTPIEKGAALLESLVINHPFVDGNKRMGYIIMRLFLLKHNLDIQATQDQKFELVTSIAAGNLKIEQIISWIRNHITENG